MRVYTARRVDGLTGVTVVVVLLVEVKAMFGRVGGGVVSLGGG